MSWRIAQAVFIEKFNAKFEKVTKKRSLGNTKRGSSGFGSTCLSVIKKMKIEDLQPANKKKVSEVANEKEISESVTSEVKEKMI